MSDTPVPQFPETASAQNTTSFLTLHDVYALFMETFLILGRYFIIVYPVFGYFILAGMLTPNVPPNYSHWSWWVLSVGMAALLFLFQAGWQAMMYKAIEDWQALKKSIEDQSVPISGFAVLPFGLFKAFIPGVGEFGLSFVLGNILSAVLALLPVMVVIAVKLWTMGVPHAAINVAKLQSIEDFVNLVFPMDKPQADIWGYLMLIGLLIAFFVFIFTMFWQQYVIIKHCNPLKAFYFSFKQVMCYPFKSTLIFVSYGLFVLFCNLLNITSQWVAFFGKFLLMVAIVFYGLFLFRFLSRVSP